MKPFFLKKVRNKEQLLYCTLDTKAFSKSMQWTFNVYFGPWRSLEFKHPWPTPTVMIFHLKESQLSADILRGWMLSVIICLQIHAPDCCLLPPLSPPKRWVFFKIYSLCCFGIFSGNSPLQGGIFQGREWPNVTTMSFLLC